ncbi:MAG: HAD family hydrolase [Candidatus Hodarchaeota archaeon]
MIPIPINGILFDLDGVLFDSEPLWEKSVVATIEHFYNVSPSSDFTQTILARSNTEILKLLIQNYHPSYHSLEEEIVKTNEFLEEHFLTNMVSEIKLFPEVMSVLQFLKTQELLLAIVTNAPKRIVSKILGEILNLDTYFDSVITIDDVVKGKPNPEMLVKTLRILDLSTQEVIFIGDSLSTDGKASELANIPFILMDRKRSSIQSEINTIVSLEGLLIWIQ